MKQFNGLRFFYRASMMILGNDYSSQHRRIFDRDFDILLSSIKQYIEEFHEQEEFDNTTSIDSSSDISKVFISHASKDTDIVEEIIELLEAIGLNSNQVFCSSLEGYGIGLGDNFLETIKSELSSDSLVLFVLTEDFYNSPVCLCEMGASWVLSKEHIPIIVPPLDYADMKGVIPLSQGFKINDAMKLNLFKEKIELSFSLNNTLSLSSWERKRDRILKRINSKMQAI
jgi:hypothetical protein